MAVNGEAMCQANRRPVSPGTGYKTANATTKNGTIAYASARVGGRTRSPRTPASASWLAILPPSRTSDSPD
jgi:hypothetical protein